MLIYNFEVRLVQYDYEQEKGYYYFKNASIFQFLQTHVASQICAVGAELLAKLRDIAVQSRCVRHAVMSCCKAQMQVCRVEARDICRYVQWETQLQNDRKQSV
jgi:hypothetical protein